MLALNPRSVRIPDAVITIPAALESVPAGFPSPAQDYFDHDLDPTTLLIEHHATTRILSANGDEMTAAGIFDGDSLIVDRGITPMDGHVVIAFLDGELAVRRLRVHPSGHVLLAAESDLHHDMEVPGMSDLTIWGVVTWVLHRVSPSTLPLPIMVDDFDFDLAAFLIPQPVSTFILNTSGHSMTGAGIHDGDKLIVDRGEAPADGRVVIAILDGELTIKRLQLGPDGQVTLMAENPDYPNIEVAGIAELQVWGTVMWSMHKLARS